MIWIDREVSDWTERFLKKRFSALVTLAFGPVILQFFMQPLLHLLCIFADCSLVGMFILCFLEREEGVPIAPTQT